MITDKPIVKLPGCPPIPDVASAIITYMVTFDRLPELDRPGRPLMFYGQRIHDKCYRRAHFDAREFVESWDDDAARKGYCLYKMGCKGPTTYNACSTTRWNGGGVSFPSSPANGLSGDVRKTASGIAGSFYSRGWISHKWGRIQLPIPKSPRLASWRPVSVFTQSPAPSINTTATNSKLADAGQQSPDNKDKQA